MRGMTEYQKAKKEAKKEARREASRAGAALESKSRAGVAEKQTTRKTWQSVSKRPRVSTSQGEPDQRK